MWKYTLHLNISHRRNFLDLPDKNNSNHHLQLKFFKINFVSEETNWCLLQDKMRKMMYRFWQLTIEGLCLAQVNESGYIALFVVSRSIKKLFSIDYVNIYFFSIFFSIDFALWKIVGLTQIAYIINFN